MVLQGYKSRKKVVLSGNISELGDVFLLTSRIMEVEFTDGWCF